MRRVVMLVAAVVLVVAAASVIAIRQRDDVPDYERSDSTGAADHDFVIPPGTAERVRNHELIEILPRRLDVQVGETIRIRNQDNEGQLVGIFYVGAGETVRMRFTAPGELSGTCEIHPDGEFTIMVHEQ